MSRSQPITRHNKFLTRHVRASERPGTKQEKEDNEGGDDNEKVGRVSGSFSEVADIPKVSEGIPEEDRNEEANSASEAVAEILKVLEGIQKEDRDEEAGRVGSGASEVTEVISKASEDSDEEVRRVDGLLKELKGILEEDKDEIGGLSQTLVEYELTELPLPIVDVSEGGSSDDD